VPTWLVIVLAAAVVLVVVLAVAGSVILSRREREGRAGFEQQLQEADRALARAHAEDRGWERAVLDAAVRGALESSHPDVEINELALLQVIDLPGVEEDEAIFLCRTSGGERRVRLVRRGGDWSVGALE
jgi:hypothetical protein